MPFKNPPKLYSVWRSMRDRCLNPNYKQWADYGGRGISICPEWSDYKTFERDMSPRPDGYSLDRIDNDGSYSSGNCRWASRQEQQRNQRRAVFVIIDGKQYRAIELAEQSGWKVDTIVARAAKGMTYEQVMSSEEYINKWAWKLAVAARVAKQRAKTHCKHGHEFTSQNTYFYRNCRSCRECARLKEARRRKSAA